MTKQKKLRHLEYYDLQDTFDKLYADSKNNKIFTKLMQIIASEENIKLAYRNIKSNVGSKTSGVDKVNINDIEKLNSQDFIEIIQRKFEWYKPKPVKRVEISAIILCVSAVTVLVLCSERTLPRRLIFLDGAKIITE